MSLISTPGMKVGLMVVISSLIIGGMAMRVGTGVGWAGGKKYFFRLSDATGIVPKSAVKMAGIKVGVVDAIVLEDGRARLDLMLEKHVVLFRDAKVNIRMMGILGDKFVELQRGSEASGELPEDSEMGQIQFSGSVENVMTEVSDLAASLKQVSETLLIAAQGKGDREQPISRIVDNLDRVTQQLANMTEDNRESLESIVDDIRSVASNLRKTTQKENLEKIERTLANIEEITDKVNQGEGTIGKLVNDEKTVTGINTAIEGVNRFLGTANRIQTSVALRAEYLGQSALNRTYLGIRITPGLDRYYEIAVVDDPMGLMERVDTSTLTGGNLTQTSEVKVWRNKVKFTALLAKNFYDFTIRGGIIESSGGLAADYHMFRKRLSFGIEAFDFQPSNVRWRAHVKFVPYHGFTIVAGGDDWNGASRPFSSYLGAGLEFTNDDLKMVFAR